MSESRSEAERARSDRHGDAVAELLADPARALVALDFDGTLAPIVARPADARPAAGARDVLAALAATVGTVAIVTGRPAAELLSLSGFAGIGGLHVLGHYGLEHAYDGELSSPPALPGVDEVRAALPGLLADADPGVAVEDKQLSIAVHTRRAADPAGELDRLLPRLRELAAAARLEAVPGRYVLELRPAGMDKGHALRALIDDAGARVVIYAGDDLGDLPAYDVVDSLAAAGTITGLTVASADSAQADAPPALAERAGLTVAGPDALVAWLAGIAELLR